MEGFGVLQVVVCLVSVFLQVHCVPLDEPMQNAPIKTSNYSYKTEYFRQPVDHFGFANTDTYLQKYLIADQFWKRGEGPILFYAGNEGTIELFCANTGFIWDAAPEFNALVIFAEHRYYGASQPYGNASYTNKTNLGYLTSEQALADFAQLLSTLRRTLPGARDVPIIALGGSYGGMLAAWMRIKYPHIIQGALASSAPIWQFTNITSCDVFNQIVTQDFKLANPECAKSIRRSWDVMNKFHKTDEGRSFLSKTLRLCLPLQEKDLQPLKDWFNEMYGNLAMVNYPYAANFLEPLPAWPIKAFCKSLTDSSMEDHQLIKALADGVNLYFNYTGNMPCFNITVQSTSDLGNDGWDFQACTEMVMPMCADGINDMFDPYAWNFTSFAAECYRKYKAWPRDDMAEVIYGGKNISAASNIIFSNGNLDPWSGGGVLKSLSKSLIAIYITDSAHHLDLRSLHPDDPASVTQARITEKKIFRQWIKDYYNGLR